MQLFKEYLLRNDIYLPVIEHHKESSLILYCAKPNFYTKSNWLFFDIKMQDDAYHPSFYRFNFKYPIHNGFLKDKIFGKYNHCDKNWDEYEDFLHTWILCNNNFVPLKGSKNVKILTLWEIFIFCFDAFFIEQKKTLQDLIYKTLDLDNSLEDRYVWHQEALLHFSCHHPYLLKTWKYDFLFCLSFYADWLVDYIESIKIK